MTPYFLIHQLPVTPIINIVQLPVTPIFNIVQLPVTPFFNLDRHIPVKFRVKYPPQALTPRSQGHGKQCHVKAIFPLYAVSLILGGWGRGYFEAILAS